mgnify:CR=1 FL=1
MTRTAWECPRCQRMNAPHVDRCDCAPNTPEIVPPRTPAPSLPNPFKPFDTSGTITTAPNTYVITYLGPKPYTYYVI